MQATRGKRSRRRRRNGASTSDRSKDTDVDIDAASAASACSRAILAECDIAGLDRSYIEQVLSAFDAAASSRSLSVKELCCDIRQICDGIFMMKFLIASHWQLIVSL